MTAQFSVGDIVSWVELGGSLPHKTVGRILEVEAGDGRVLVSTVGDACIRTGEHRYLRPRVLRRLSPLEQLAMSAE